MIQAEVTLDYDDSLDRLEWLLQNVGRRSGFADQVDEDRPWYVDYLFKQEVYRFAREADAIMFRLRWA